MSHVGGEVMIEHTHGVVPDEKSRALLVIFCSRTDVRKAVSVYLLFDTLKMEL